MPAPASDRPFLTTIPRLAVSGILGPLALYAIRVAVQGPQAATPIDRDLPLVALLVVAAAWTARDSRWAAAVESAVPLLGIAMLFFPNERLRLLAFGVIVAAAFAIAVMVVRERFAESAVLTLAAVMLLRWLPVSQVAVWRELVILGGTLVLLAAVAAVPHPSLRSTFPRLRQGEGIAQERAPGEARVSEPSLPPLALIAVVAVSAATPIHPGRMTLFPLAVAAGVALLRWPPAAAIAAAALAVVAYGARWSHVPLLLTAAFALLVPFLSLLRPLLYGVALALFAMWPWSGIVVRALPVVTRYEPVTGTLRPIGWALAPGESATIDLGPPSGPARRWHSVIVDASGANLAGMPPGRVVGSIDAIDRSGAVCTRDVRIGDIADFGFGRPEHFFASRNPLPRVSRGEIHGYGAEAWLHGEGSIGVTCRGDLTALRVRAARTLPAAARLQIEGIELPAR